MNEILSSKIVDYSKLTPRIHKILIERPENFVFYAGQYIKLFFDDGSYKLYSIAKAAADNILEFHIQEPTTNTILKDFLLNLHHKLPISISKPLGKCISPRTISHPVILIAGGCGFAHSLSIIEDISKKKNVNYPVHLYWGVDKLSDLYYYEYLSHLNTNTKWFNFEIILGKPMSSWKGRVGFVTDFIFKDYHNLQNYILFASGPPAMVETAYRKGIENKLNPTRFHSDHQISNTVLVEAVIN